MKAYLCATALAFSDGVAMQSVAFGAEGEQQQPKGDRKSVGKEKKEQDSEQDSDSEDDSVLGYTSALHHSLNPPPQPSTTPSP